MLATNLRPGVRVACSGRLDEAFSLDRRFRRVLLCGLARRKAL